MLKSIIYILIITLSLTFVSLNPLTSYPAGPWSLPPEVGRLWRQAGESDITIDNISFGALLMGEELTKEDLIDCVVGIEFWGLKCGPCRAMMPHLVEWHKKYSSKGLVLLGFHRQNEPKEAVIEFCKSVKIPFSIYQGGNVSGLSFSGIPHFTLFDHTGKMIYDGHPMAADKKLIEAMMSIPDPLVGEGPYKKLKDLTQKITQRKELGKILVTLKTKHINSANEEEKTEAAELILRLNRFADKLLVKAEHLKKSEPLNSFNLFQHVATLFKGDEIGDNAQKIVDELQKDKAFQDNMKADKELAEMMPDIEKLKPCNKCSAFKVDCEVCRNKNPSLEVLIPKVKNLIKKYPASPAAVKIKGLLPLN